METELKNHLKSLASLYENEEFLVGDPSWFMHQVEDSLDKELLAFIASSLSYGSRKQFMPKIQFILDKSQGHLYDWIVNQDYTAYIPDNKECYYRLYTNSMMLQFFDAIRLMLKEYGSIRNFAESLKTDNTLYIIKGLTEWFAGHGSTGIIPKDTISSCKRLCMFLRWMVRKDSPVDIGIWNDIIDQRTLIIPMDTHVVQEASRLGLISSKTASMANAIKLTKRLAEIFPDDPVKADFALFGYGIDENQR